jgi:hypothetical protein
MSVYFEGNAYIDGGKIQNALVSLSSVGNCRITTSSLDMNLQNITSVLDPVLPQDAATKKYVDNLGIVITDVTLSGTNETLVSSSLKGSYTVLVTNNVANGPTAVFHVTKNEAPRHAHITRTVATPGYQTDTSLRVTWLPNDGIYLKKTASYFDGSYTIKIF